MRSCLTRQDRFCSRISIPTADVEPFWIIKRGLMSRIKTSIPWILSHSCLIGPVPPIRSWIIVDELFFKIRGPETPIAAQGLHQIICHVLSSSIRHPAAAIEFIHVGIDEGLPGFSLLPLLKNFPGNRLGCARLHAGEEPWSPFLCHPMEIFPPKNFEK